MDNNMYWVWLSSLTKIIPRKRVELLDKFKDPVNIWNASEEELRKIEKISNIDIDILMNENLRRSAGILLERLQLLNVEIISLNSKLYPESLKMIYDPPVVIYKKGELLPNEQCIAVVGSRRASLYGLDTARKISEELSECGLTIVSGMARGIDSKAHESALGAGGRTIAVLGCGLDIVYPSENRTLMNKICESGAVISEFLPGVPPLSYNFPTRNRIISGMSLGTVIIEASEKSGSLITANCALEQGRDVFAVPGNINSKNSAGTNNLIREGAKIVLETADILDELKIFNHVNNTFCRNKNKLTCSQLDKDEISIVKRLKEDNAHIDLIARDCNLSIQTVSSIMIMLELKGVVEQMHGKIYRLKS